MGFALYGILIIEYVWKCTCIHFSELCIACRVALNFMSWKVQWIHDAVNICMKQNSACERFCDITITSLWRISKMASEQDLSLCQLIITLCGWQKKVGELSRQAWYGAVIMGRFLRRESCIIQSTTPVSHVLIYHYIQLHQTYVFWLDTIKIKSFLYYRQKYSTTGKCQMVIMLFLSELSEKNALSSFMQFWCWS